MLAAMTRQPVSLSPLVVAADSHQGLKVGLLPWEPMAVLHQGLEVTGAPRDMISLAEVEGEEGEVAVMVVEEEEVTEILAATAVVEVAEATAVEVEDMVEAATTGRAEEGGTVEEVEWRRSSRTTRYLSRVFLLTPPRRTLLSSSDPSGSSRMTGKPAIRESSSTKTTTRDCRKEKPP